MTRARLRKSRGQSFVEAMIAITIIVTSITSALTLVQSSITASRISGAQVIANNLAREGIEVARSIRDSDWLAGNKFTVGLSSLTSKTARPVFDPALGQWSLLFGDVTLDENRSAVYLMPDGTYQQADAAPANSVRSPYNRALVLDYVCRDNASGAERTVTGGDNCLATETLVALAVKSSVRWAAIAGVKRTVTAEERIYDWR